ncbi:MAG TPA: MBL fold metallo-hydrolase [Gammaproteobacteria bacterium]
MKARFVLGLSFAALALLAGAASAQRGGARETPPVALSRIAGNVYLVSGGGGANATALVGDDGVLLVDSKLDEASGKAVAAALAEITDGPVRFLLNTHVHPDHTGGNAVFGRAGAVIVGHEEVRTILAAGQRGGPPAPPEALPAMTFGDGAGVTLHLNGEEVRVRHVSPAHTADNSIVHYVSANVFHLGDVYSPSRYPVLAGGTLQGFIDDVDAVLRLADADSRFVPGSGAVGGMAELRAYREMLVTVRDRVSALVAEGKSLDEVLAAKPTAGFDETWGSPDSRLFLPVVYAQLAGRD